MADTKTSSHAGWVNLGLVDEPVAASNCADLKRFLVKEMYAIRWKDFNYADLQLQVQDEEGYWTAPKASDAVPWLAEEPLPVQIVPLVDRQGNPLEEFRGQRFVRISLQALTEDPTIIKPERMESVPAASNYLVQTIIGLQTNIRSVCSILDHFSPSGICLRDHASCTNAPAACALLVNPAWLQ
eukprot:m.920116 g.920116  ORF g.920116 m.920116 type:complete len:184 (+) comp61243_c0_seq1:77-628(+)